MSEPAVFFEGVSKSFGQVRAVAGLDLSIAAGQTVALLGPNGAGKSTTVGLLLGLLPPDSGRIRVLGEDPDRAVAAGRIGVMLQDGGLMPGVTVRALVEMAAALYRDPRPVTRLLAEADLTGIASRRVDRLSGGQAQRLRFALAIVGNPQVLVLDEPTAAMDVQARRAFWRNIRAYAADGHTILFATHYLEEADDNADRIVVIAGGRLVADGTPAQVKATAGGRTVRFTLGDQSVAGLERLPAVNAVAVHGATAVLHTTDPEATLRALFEARDRLPGLEVGGAELEDAVLALTDAAT